MFFLANMVKNSANNIEVTERNLSRWKEKGRLVRLQQASYIYIYFKKQWTQTIYLFISYHLTFCLYLHITLFSIFKKDIFYFLKLFLGTSSKLIKFYLDSFIGPIGWCACLFPPKTVLEFCNLWTEFSLLRLTMQM